MTNTVTIFTDGSSLGNPGPGGWGAIVIAGDSAYELGGGERHTTNNRMELTAAIQALTYLGTLPSFSKLSSLPAYAASTQPEGFREAAGESGTSRACTIAFYTDSRYVINGITKWVYGWKKNNWKTSTKEDVSNRDLWEALHMRVGRYDIAWTYVPGHSGVPGNERVDEIATAFARGDDPGLYAGPVGDYPIDSMRFEPIVANVRTKKARSAKAYSYLSLLDGRLYRDATWEACQGRVKGRSGAKFRKALSAEDEEAILKEWGVS